MVPGNPHITHTQQLSQSSFCKSLKIKIIKKITLQIFSLLCLISSISYGQTYSTGLFDVWGVIEGQIDINTSTDIVTITIIGPDDSYLAMGFDTDWHTNGKDVVIFDGTNLTDRSFTGSQELPDIDVEQDWTISSGGNTTNAGLRTLVATRVRDTGNANDFVFPTISGSLVVAGSHGNNTFNLNHHGAADFKTVSFSLLGLEDFNEITFSMSPNPATSNLKVVLPSNLQNASIEIFDMLARKIFDGKLINTHFSIIDVSAWSSGVYLVKVSNGASTMTKRFIKQ